jgi:hypothetical protein
MAFFFFFLIILNFALGRNRTRDPRVPEPKRTPLGHILPKKIYIIFSYPTSTRRHGNFAGVHTLLRIILSSNSAVLINIITGVSPPHFDFFVFYVLCQC